MALDLSDGAEVDNHQVHHLKDEGNDCVCDQQAVVNIQVAVFFVRKIWYLDSRANCNADV